MEERKNIEFELICDTLFLGSVLCIDSVSTGSVLFINSLSTGSVLFLDSLPDLDKKLCN